LIHGQVDADPGTCPDHPVGRPTTAFRSYLIAEWNASDYNRQSSLQAALAEEQLARLTLKGGERISPGGEHLQVLSDGGHAHADFEITTVDVTSAPNTAAQTQLGASDRSAQKPNFKLTVKRRPVGIEAGRSCAVEVLFV
jgi:hypothetical protein